MTKKTQKQAPVQQSQLPVNSLYSTGRPVQQQNIPKGLIVLAAVGSMLVTALFFALYVWADSYEETTQTTAPTNTDADLWILAIIAAIILLPGIIVALIVLPKLKKK